MNEAGRSESRGRMAAAPAERGPRDTEPGQVVQLYGLNRVAAGGFPYGVDDGRHKCSASESRRRHRHARRDPDRPGPSRPTRSSGLIYVTVSIVRSGPCTNRGIRLLLARNLKPTHRFRQVWAPG